MSKKKTALDKIIIGIGIFLIVAVFFSGCIIFLSFIPKTMNIIFLLSFLVIIFIVLFALISINTSASKEAAATRSKPKQTLLKDEKEKITTKNQPEEIQAPLKEREDGRISRESEGYRHFYNLPKDIQLYHYGNIFSDYQMRATNHEQSIAKKLIESKFFNANCIFLDSYFKTRNGGTVQIDIISVNQYGVFVIESKDFSGWIFGNGGQTQWTETMNKKKYRFYNPIKQNANHIKILRDILGGNTRFHSLVVFGDKANIQNISYIPENTYVFTSRKLDKVFCDIAKQAKAHYSDDDISRICREIHKNQIHPDEGLRSSHIDEIKKITGENRLYY